MPTSTKSAKVGGAMRGITKKFAGRETVARKTPSPVSPSAREAARSLESRRSLIRPRLVIFKANPAGLEILVSKRVGDEV